jgi:hypothetical protein
MFCFELKLTVSSRLIFLLSVAGVEVHASAVNQK